MPTDDNRTIDLEKTVSEIDEGYEYLMAYASHAEETGEDVAEEYIETIYENLKTIQGAFETISQENDAFADYYAWTADQAKLALSALALYLEHSETSPDRVNALLSVPPLRNSLTSVIYLEDIGAI